MPEFNPEQRKNVNLRIIPATGDKHVMIGFDAHSDEEAEAYNEACTHYLKNLRSFHQVGHEGGPGYSAWEIWQEIDNEILSGLISQIENDAQILLSQVGVEELYERWQS